MVPVDPPPPPFWYQVWVHNRLGTGNIKEILAKSKVKTLTNDEDDPGSRPCDKDCSYCYLLRETEGKDFKSVTTGCKYKMRQKTTCEAKDFILSSYM